VCQENCIDFIAIMCTLYTLISPKRLSSRRSTLKGIGYTYSVCSISPDLGRKCFRHVVPILLSSKCRFSNSALQRCKFFKYKKCMMSFIELIFDTKVVRTNVVHKWVIWYGCSLQKTGLLLLAETTPSAITLKIGPLVSFAIQFTYAKFHINNFTLFCENGGR